MNRQLPLPGAPAYVGSELWKSQLEAIESAIKYLNPKVVAEVLDLGVNYLLDSVKGVDRKVWHGEWTLAVKVMLVQRRDQAARDHFRAICNFDIGAGVIGAHLLLIDDDKISIEEENAELRRIANRTEDGAKAAAAIPRGRR